MEIRRMRLDDLFPADYNPRKALKRGDPEYEKLRRSIETFSLVEPLIWNEETGRLVGGHQRLTVLRDMGISEVEVSIVHLDDGHEKALNVAMNKISGAWNNDALVALLRGLNDNMALLSGFSELDLEALLGEKKTKDKGAGDDADLPIISRRGDIWMLGKHRLMCGDSCCPEDVDSLVAGEPVRLVITDPPYNVSYEAKVADQATQSVRRATSRIENDSMEDAAFRQFLLDAYTQMYRVMAPGAAIYVFHADTEGLNFRAAFREVGFKLSGCLVWAKSSIVLGRSDYQWRHEPILYGWRPDGSHKWYGGRKKTTLLQDISGVTIRQETDGSTIFTFSDGLHIVSIRVKDYEVLDNALDAMSSVIYHEKPSSNDLHPTMKPVELVAKLMRNSSKRGDLVADFFNGSGSTLIACEENGRRCCAMELEPFYCDQTVRRYLAYTQREDVFLLRDGQRLDFSKAFGCE